MAPDAFSSAGTGKLQPALGSRKGYVTFLAGTGDYVKGVVGLAKGLRKVKSIYPLVVAILPDVPEEHREILRAQGCIVKEIEPVYPPPNQTQFAMAYYVINYSKLRIWNVSTFLNFFHACLHSFVLNLIVINVETQVYVCDCLCLVEKSYPLKKNMHFRKVLCLLKSLHSVFYYKKLCLEN